MDVDPLDGQAYLSRVQEGESRNLLELSMCIINACMKVTFAAVSLISMFAVTIAGSFPPLQLLLTTMRRARNAILTYNSRVTRFNIFEALAMTNFPVAVDPVKLIFFGPGCDVSHGPRLSSPLKTCTTPGGKKFCASSPSFRSQYGVNGEGLMIIELPVSTAGAILPQARWIGKFHGTIPTATPSGVYRVMTFFSLFSSMMDSFSSILASSLSQ